jgi:hypothetical protein
MAPLSELVDDLLVELRLLSDDPASLLRASLPYKSCAASSLIPLLPSSRLCMHHW